jgi:hypothetical protein
MKHGARGSLDRSRGKQGSLACNSAKARSEARDKARDKAYNGQHGESKTGKSRVSFMVIKV